VHKSNSENQSTQTQSSKKKNKQNKQNRASSSEKKSHQRKRNPKFIIAAGSPTHSNIETSVMQ
jgi:hypothetical protein